MLFPVTLLVPPWGGAKVRFAGLTERGLRHLEALGWHRETRSRQEHGSGRTRRSKAG